MKRGTISIFVSSLYGTLIWALDSPGYVLRGSNATLAAFDRPFLDVAEYILTLPVTADTLTSLEPDLGRRFTVNLMKPEKNLTLTEVVSRGQPQVANPTQSGVGARIWLDEEGFSVSPDTQVMFVGSRDASGAMIPAGCPEAGPIKPGIIGLMWSCTHNNSFALGQLDFSTSLHQEHWDDETDARMTRAISYQTGSIIPGRRRARESARL